MDSDQRPFEDNSGPRQLLLIIKQNVYKDQMVRSFSKKVGELNLFGVHRCSKAAMDRMEPGSRAGHPTLGPSSGLIQGWPHLPPSRGRSARPDWTVLCLPSSVILV